MKLLKTSLSCPHPEMGWAGSVMCEKTDVLEAIA
ncbi:hypothetical protein RD1_4052 [Roseobacter denitrificans OCh 114]|uniref:Uncharacterized protein n=1 Tax=Roseobacter denitrificans (strain ATCC 33942 / OCh 114) TaxID=375451 RepID=Q160U7_ROSDO|nr:hypothetical protein RD1_4052 [Roseobacter denitrificans OCh 114]